MAFLRPDKEKVPRKEENKVNRYMAARGLDNMPAEYVMAVKRIMSGQLGNSFFKVSNLLTGSAADQLMASHLVTLIEQNWIIINQNSDILEELQRMNQAPSDEVLK